jgi:hypothetical protein
MTFLWTLLAIVVFIGVSIIFHVIYTDDKTLYRQHYTSEQIQRIRNMFKFLKIK